MALTTSFYKNPLSWEANSTNWGGASTEETETSKASRIDETTQDKIDSGSYDYDAAELESKANAASARKSSEGYLAEKDAYTNAALITDQQARLARVSGQISQYQEQRSLNRALGEQRADVASAGFGKGGSSIYLARDSAQQGYLAKALAGYNAEIKAGGYEDTGRADRATGAAAQIASDSYLDLASAYDSLGAMDKSLSTLAASDYAADKEDTETTTTKSSTSSGTGMSFKVNTKSLDKADKELGVGKYASNDAEYNQPNDGFKATDYGADDFV